MSTSQTKGQEAILALFGVPAMVAASMCWRGYVLSVLWGWFMVPHLAAPPLRVPVAIGVSLIVGFLTHSFWPNKGEEPSMIKAAGLAVLGPATVLLIGWIVAKFL